MYLQLVAPDLWCCLGSRGSSNHKKMKEVSSVVRGFWGSVGLGLVMPRVGVGGL